jgi:universal stress protein E
LKLLCATDLLPRSDYAVDRAGRLAEELQAELSLLHVIRASESERALEQALQLAIRHLRSRARPPLWGWAVSPKVIVRPGSAVRIIADAVHRQRADLLVVGPRRRRGMLEAFEGSIADKVLRSQRCPVLIVHEAPCSSYKRVVFGLDTSAASIAAVRAGEGLVLRPDTAATIVHAYEPRVQGLVHVAANGGGRLRYSKDDDQEAATAIRDMLKFESRDFSRFEIRASEGKPALEILRAAEETRADLIVVGTRAVGRMQRALAGSVANQVIKRATCDVLVVSESAVSVPEVRPQRTIRERAAESDRRAHVFSGNHRDAARS